MQIIIYLKETLDYLESKGKPAVVRNLALVEQKTTEKGVEYLKVTLNGKSNGI